jgi:hypothetical protein
MLSKSLLVQPEHLGMFARDHPEMVWGRRHSRGSNNGSRRNSPKTIVYNQCVNELLRYAVKSYRGILGEDEVPKDIYDNSRLPQPPQPGDIDVITAGFPWCVFAS